MGYAQTSGQRPGHESIVAGLFEGGLASPGDALGGPAAEKQEKSAAIDSTR